MKANWSCTACGMYSSRRYSVQRHIHNKHSGRGMVIPFIEYLVGRRIGWYPPQLPPNYGSKEKTLQDRMKKEAENIYVRRVAEQCIPPSGDPGYADSIKMLRLYLANRGFRQTET
jgi:hypothetical protein